MSEVAAATIGADGDRPSVVDEAAKRRQCVMSTQGREKSRAMREARAGELAREQRRHRTFRLIGAVVIIGLLVAIAVAVARSITSDDGPRATGSVVTPANIRDSAFAVGEADAPVTLELYYDYMCPACGAFEHTNSGDLTRLIEDGVLRVRLHVMSFLDPMSQGTEYSSRAANAYATVVDRAPDRVWDFHTALYQHQPAEGTVGLSDNELAAIATEVGVPAGVAETFTDGVHRGWIVRSTQAANDSGVSHTPTLLLNGEEFTDDWSTPGALADAVEQAAADGRS
jgi:protein-disulfide isomerase